MKPPHSDSPRSSRRPAHQPPENPRQRQARNAEEIIRFVREFQFDRQPSSLGLQKKAPLPGIGQLAIKNTCTTGDSGFLDRGLDSTDSDNDSLDNEIVHAQQRRNTTRKVDPFFIEYLTCPRATAKASNDYDVLSRSLTSHVVPQDVYNNNIPTRVSKQNSFIRHGKKHVQGTGARPTGKQLPPLSRDRDAAPERPSAPSPSRTPPVSDYSFIEEEPVDYLDLS